MKKQSSKGGFIFYVVMALMCLSRKQILPAIFMFGCAVLCMPAVKKKLRTNKGVRMAAVLVCLVLGMGSYEPEAFLQLADAIVQSADEPESVQTADEPEEAIQPEDWEHTASSDMEVHFIDVGQGDATLVKCGDAAMLIDAGEDSKGTLIQNYLKKQGVEKLDYLVLTHPDSDHIGGAPVIITKFEVDRVFVSDFEKDNRTYRKLIQALDDKNIQAQTPEPGDEYALAEASFRILGPVKSYDDSNNASLVLLLQNGENSFLFTGDAGEEAEQDMLDSGADVKADVYQAGHHGSKTSTSEEFLDAVNPTAVVVSCEEGNSYGHPHAQTLNRLRSRGIELFRTDEQGSVTAESDGKEIVWNCAPSDTWQAGEPAGSSREKEDVQD